MANLIESSICVCIHEERWHYEEFCSQCARVAEHGGNNPPNPEHWFLRLTPFLNQCLVKWTQENLCRQIKVNEDG